MNDESEACGSHVLGEAIPNSVFDYTCDDCVLPANHQDPEEQNDVREYAL